MTKIEKERTLVVHLLGTKENPIITVTKTPNNMEGTNIDLSISKKEYTQKFLEWFEENQDSIESELYVHWNYGDFVNSYCISKKRT